MSEENEQQEEQQDLGIEVEATPQKLPLALGSINLFPSDLGERFGLDKRSQTIRIPKDFKSRVKLSRDIYFNEAVVGTVIDLMIDFSTTGMENISDDKEAKEFFDKLCKYSDMDNLHRWLFWEYLITGDVFVLRGEEQKVKTGKDKGSTYFPFTVLNPLNIEVFDGLFMGKEILGIKPNQEFIKLYNDKRTKNIVINSLPKEVRAVLRKEKVLSASTIIPLPEERTSRISRKRQPYQKFATPFLTRIFEPVLIKRAMRQADMATAEGLTNFLIKVTEGNDDYPSTDARLQRLAALFANPAKTKMIFWNHTLDIEMFRPPVDIFKDDKYSQLNKDIIDGLGVIDILISGGGSNFATAWVGVMALIERLEGVRNQVRRWQELEYRRIADELGLNFKSVPKVKLHKINLKDEKVYFTVMQNMYDRGLLSAETMHEVFGLDADVERKKKENETKKGINKIFEPPYTPFSGQDPTSPPKPPATPKPPSNKPGGTGRPKNKVKNDYTKRGQPSPKGQASLDLDFLGTEGGEVDGESSTTEESG